MIGSIPCKVGAQALDDKGRTLNLLEDGRLELALVMERAGKRLAAPLIELTLWADSGKTRIDLPAMSAAALLDRLTPIVRALIAPAPSRAIPAPPVRV